MHSIDYKFIVIPIVFVLLRTGSLIQHLLMYAHVQERNVRVLDEIIRYVSVSYSS